MAARISSCLRQNVLGFVAIFIALSAAAYAVNEKAPKNSVVSKSIKNGQVKKKDLAANSVDSTKVVDESLTGADIQEGTLQVPGDGNSGGTVKSVATGAGLTGGPITQSGTIAFEACPSGQILKSTGSDYSCAADDDVPPPNSVGSPQIIDESIGVSDLGTSIGIGTDVPSIADGACTTILSENVFGASWESTDFVITSDTIDTPAGVILTGEVVGDNDVELQLCNFSGAPFDPSPVAGYAYLVIEDD